ncbi:MAG: response regulator [Myxococcales bacterium]|nr:response regulator [Myxococcales bacterium]
MRAHQLLIADDERLLRDLLERAVIDQGWAARTAADGHQTIDLALAEPPDVLILDLMMPEVDGFEVLRTLRADTRTAGVQIIVLTARAGQDILQDALEAGADDFIPKPFHLGEVMARVKAQLRIAEYKRALERQRRDGHILLDISHRLTSRLDIQSILQDVTGLVAEVLGIERCSVVLVGKDEVGRVVATSDDAGLTDRPIDLDGYPEIRHVIGTRQPLVVADIRVDPLFDPVKDRLARLSVRSAALFPLLEGEHCIGVLFLRSTRRLADFGEREHQFGQIVANATAVAISNARLFHELKAESHRISHARAVVEQRLRAVERYEDFFENSADGMLITDPNGRVLFLNRQAEAITGQARETLTGHALAPLVDEAGQPALAALFEGARAGDFSQRADLHLRDRETIISVNAARVPGDPAFCLTLRDVTTERTLADQLAETQRRLAESEKLALLAEVAGTTAHEINQPLTSVVGYAQIAARRLPEDADPLLRKAVSTIEREAGRIAEIVRRIGRITRYETRPYVGSARILDLQAAADNDPED